MHRKWFDASVADVSAHFRLDQKLTITGILIIYFWSLKDTTILQKNNV